MSKEGITETVSIEKSKLDKLLSTLDKLVDKVDKLEHDLEEARQPIVQGPPRPPVFHSQSLANAQANRANREFEQEAKVQQSLEKATEFVIEDYRRKPIRR